ncbi:MAG: flavin reductase family protein [Bradymonadia bacterium]
MQIDPQEIPSRDVYFHMISTIVPRPIAWVSTIDGEGRVNLAPFSFFTGITSRPPTLCICVGNRRDGTPKDTAANIEATGAFVVNVVPHALTAQMVQTSAGYAPGADELAAVGLSTTPSIKVKPPRVLEAPAQFECTLHQRVPIMDGDEITSRMLIGRIEMIHIRDDVLDNRGFADPALLDAIGRMGGRNYVRAHEVFSGGKPSDPAEGAS